MKMLRPSNPKIRKGNTPWAWALSLALLLIGFINGCCLGGGGTQKTGPTNYVLQLERAQVWEGVIPYTNNFPNFGLLNGILTALQNPGLPLNNYPVVLVSPTDPAKKVPLSPGATSTSADIKMLYGSETPKLPVKIIAIPQNTGGLVFERIPIVVFYTVQ